MPFLQRVAIVVDDYDAAIGFFVDVLGFELVEDSPAVTNAGDPKRWVVVRPPGAETGILLARADGPEQAAVVGKQRPERLTPNPVAPAERKRWQSVRHEDRALESAQGVEGLREVVEERARIFEADAQSHS